MKETKGYRIARRIALEELATGVRVKPNIRFGASARRAVRDVLRERFGKHCWLCDRPILDTHVETLDHVQPRAKGGSNSILNLRLAHRDCNTRRGDGPPPVLKLHRLYTGDEPLCGQIRAAGATAWADTPQAP